MSDTHIQDHVELIAKHEQEFLAKRTCAERVGDSIATFVGSIPFVVAHVILFGAWILLNTLRVPHVKHFDPEPFSLLSTIVGLEAILLVSFVLMRQMRMGRRAEQRDHLTLQVLLLAEKEITALLRMERQVANKVGLEKTANSQEVRELSQSVSIEHVAQTILENLPNE